MGGTRFPAPPPECPGKLAPRLYRVLSFFWLSFWICLGRGTKFLICFYFWPCKCHIFVLMPLHSRHSHDDLKSFWQLFIHLAPNEPEMPEVDHKHSSYYSFVSKNKWHSPKLQSSPWNTPGKHIVNFLLVLPIHILLTFPFFNGGFTWLLGHKCLQNQHCRARGKKIGGCFSNYVWDGSSGVRGTCLSLLVGLFWRAWAGVYSVFYFDLVWIKKKN